MKKFIVLVLTIFTFLGCSEELEFNTPSFQAEKDGNLWEAVTYSANIDASGVLTIVGSDGFETISLELHSTVIGQYDVVPTSSSASLLDVNDVTWSTTNTPHESVQIYPADGVIDLNEVNLETGTVSGEFYFNAFNASGLSSINFNHGVFYKVPLNGLGGTGVIELTCTEATAVVSTTGLTYNGTPTTDPNFETVCNAFKSALEAQIVACGDPVGAIQASIDGLTCM